MIKKISIFIFVMILSCGTIFADEMVPEFSEQTIGYLTMGDANRDENVTAEDALKVLKIIAKIESPDNKFSVRENDLNNNYYIDSDDALEILKVSAKIRDIEKIEDVNDFFRNVEYENGYPVDDYLSEDAGIKLDTESGRLEKEKRLLTIYEYHNNVCLDLNIINDTNITGNEYSWIIRWFITDAFKKGEVVKTDISEVEFAMPEKATFDFTGYSLYVKNILGPKFVKAHIYISETNEIYIRTNRGDFIPSANMETYSTIYKYTGEVPERLTYANIKQLDEYFDQF